MLSKYPANKRAEKELSLFKKYKMAATINPIIATRNTKEK
jgi:hypothetical protein